MPIVALLLDATAFFIRRAARLPDPKRRREGGNLILLVFGLGVFCLLLGGIFGIWQPMLAFFWVAFVWVAVMYVVQLYYAQEAKREVASELVLKALASLALASFITGKFYADHLAGSECLISFKEGRELRAIYMRSVSDGHLVALGKDRYYYPKSEVTEIKCERGGLLQ